MARPPRVIVSHSNEQLRSGTTLDMAGRDMTDGPGVSIYIAMYMYRDDHISYTDPRFSQRVAGSVNKF